MHRRRPFPIISLALAVLFASLACELAADGLEGSGATPMPTATFTQPASPTPPTQTSLPTATPEPIHLEADGSGDYATLEEAIQHAEEGGRILLGAGEFRLQAPIDVHKSLSILGAGMGETIIVSDAGGYVVSFRGNGPFYVEGIAFLHEGNKPSSVVMVSSGEFEFVRSRFTGAVSGEGAYYASGLQISGTGTGIVQECEAVDNYYGILVEDQAHATLEDNICTNNYKGIGYLDQAEGVARGNECIGNDASGFWVGDEAKPTLVENTCSDSSYGIEYFGHATGDARENECTGNSSAGIDISGDAHPVLEKNTLMNNLVGLYYWPNTYGNAQENVCSQNKLAGIFVGSNAHPSLVKNECADNQIGILIDPTADPELEENNCHDNSQGDVVNK